MENRYFVYNPAKDKPVYIHNNYADAMTEAERIANKEDECTVYVLQVVGEIDKKLKVHETKTYNNGNKEEMVYERIPF